MQGDTRYFVRHRARLLSVLGIVLLGAGIIASWLASTRHGHDYASVYVTARGVWDGAPIYDRDWQRVRFPGLGVGLGPPNGLFYPPVTGIATLPLGLMPYPLAHATWLALMIGAVVLGVRALVRLSRPQLPSYAWHITAGLVLLSSGVRWGMTTGQGAPLILGALCFFVVALHRGSLGVAGLLAAFAIAFKMTLALPFLGLLFMYRRFGILAAVLGSWLLLNVVGFARLGGLEVFHAYQHNIQGLELLNDINSPDPWRPEALPRLDWIFLLMGLTRHLQASRVAALLLGAGVGLWVIWQARQVARPIQLTLIAAMLLVLVCLTNAVVYHHHYDVSLIVAPLVLLWFTAERPKLPRWVLGLLMPLVVMVSICPVATTYGFMLEHFGLKGWGTMNLTFPVALTLAMISALAMLRGLATTRTVPQQPSAVVPEPSRA